MESAPGEKALRGQDEEAFAAVMHALVAKRDAVIAEICGYPTPIPACDAHFNWLLEVRASVFAEMRDLFALQTGERPADAAALAQFVRNSVSLDSESKIRLLGALGTD